MITWRKSSYSASSGACIELAWHKSSYSASSGDCLELKHTPTEFGIRDSKNIGGPVLRLSGEHGLAFLLAIKNSRLS